MGDRANIKVTGAGDVYLYTHWFGTELPQTLKDGLIRGTGRLDDPIYLARILFCEMVKGHEMETTGFGISGNVGDGGDRILTVDCDKLVVSWPDGTELSFSKYVALEQPSWESPGGDEDG